MNALCWNLKEAPYSNSVDVNGISNLADDDDDQLSHGNNSDKELDNSGDEVEDQNVEAGNSATDDGDNDNVESDEEESSEDDNGSDLESVGEKYNAL